MIEIGESSNVQMSREEALMYCFSLGNGWRLPTYDEYSSLPRYGIIGCYDSRINPRNTKIFFTPVRDIKDD